jgi:hypothetical protein
MCLVAINGIGQRSDFDGRIKQPPEDCFVKFSCQRITEATILTLVDKEDFLGARVLVFFFEITSSLGKR